MTEKFPRVTVSLELTSTDIRNAFDPEIDAPLSQMDALGPLSFENMLRRYFGETDGTEVTITRLEMSHDLDERETAVAA